MSGSIRVDSTAFKIPGQAPTKKAARRAQRGISVGTTVDYLRFHMMELGARVLETYRCFRAGKTLLNCAFHLSHVRCAD